MYIHTSAFVDICKHMFIHICRHDTPSAIGFTYICMGVRVCVAFYGTNDVSVHCAGDNNTILLELSTNTPIFAACRPTFTLTGLTGSVEVVNSTTLNLISSTAGVSANSTAQMEGSVYWEQSTGLMQFGVHSDIGSHPWPHLVASPSSITLQFTLTNQEQFQSAPTLGFSVQYTKAAIDGGSWDFAADFQDWNMSGDFGNNDTHLWQTKHGRDIFETNVDERRPMFIRRASFIESRIAQSYPWPSAANKITVNIKLNMDLLSSCKPMIYISKLDGACVQTSQVQLNGADADKFSSVNQSMGFATWSAVHYDGVYLPFQTLKVRPAASTNIYSPPSVLSNTEYTFEFDIVNPVFGQDGPPIRIELFTNHTTWTPALTSVLMTQNETGKPVGSYFKIGDSKALEIYPPEFIAKTVRQSNPFPGMYNNITITLAANVDLVYPASITISGWKIATLVDSLVKTQPENEGHDLAPLGPIALFNAESLVGDCPFSAADEYNCVHGPGYLKANPDSVSTGYGYFNDRYGRVVLNVGPDVIRAGTYFSFRFQFRNPNCDHEPLAPCVRANRILTNKCNSTVIPRASMQKDTVGITGVNLPTLGDTALAAKAGDAQPMLIRRPVITSAVIAQSTIHPCAENTITMTITTNVPLVVGVGHTITVSGLRGFKEGVPVPMAGPPTGNITVANTDAIFDSRGTWDLEHGILIVTLVQDSTAGFGHVFSVDLTNPASQQDCAQVTLNISTFCFNNTFSFTTPNVSNGDAKLSNQGSCGNFSSSLLSPGTPPTSFAGHAADVENGKCPLMVVHPVLHVKYINQSSQFPCTANTIQVPPSPCLSSSFCCYLGAHLRSRSFHYHNPLFPLLVVVLLITFLSLQVVLASNVPLRLCAPLLTISGLGGTMTNQSNAFAVSVLQPALSSIEGNWSGSDGTLHLDVSAVITDASCSVFTMTFELKNQRTPRGAANVSLEVNGKYSFNIQNSVLTSPSSRHEWYTSLDGMGRELHVPLSPSAITWTDPLFVKVRVYVNHTCVGLSHARVWVCACVRACVRVCVCVHACV